MPQAATACTTFESSADVDCTHCGVPMTSHMGSGQVRYFRCPSCSRWSTSMYKEVLRADTKMRARRAGAPEAQSALGSVKERLESWLLSLSGAADPYATLGVRPGVSDAELRDKYVALARAHHPDRGGDANEMRRINDAYERVLAHRAKSQAQQVALRGLKA